MLESMVEWMSHAMYYAYDGAAPPVRAGAAHASIYPYGPFPTGDGKVIMLGLQNEREWATFCQYVLMRPQLAADAAFNSNAKRSENRAALYSIIVETFAALSADQVTERLEAAQIANARLNDMQDVWNHPQLQARGRWTQVSTPAGMIPALLPPGMTGPPSSQMGAIPALGQHTDSILLELGCTRAEVEGLRSKGVI